MMNRKFIVYNPTLQPLAVGDVGLFQPGENIVELTFDQEYLLKNNAILKLRMLKPKVVEAPKVTPKHSYRTAFKVSTSKKAEI